ncbi:flagellar export apparatus protein FliQ [Terasakiispira papahanaumokuakeensis]|uniref:Flagellar biosynthetic protein FliQ n=1 Tax=Terasakiispira papahanaumokuakeensis TaxID=197479 RepID=A0A1E2VAY0_9GAMM|nr:flagellar biosynthesis protein FliQ [Terasakiispira papahanaumokuakeensis]ODC04147.1 flagellar export apparatus protein FliQ [Terasakiispira papahanaumokuakeensis]
MNPGETLDLLRQALFLVITIVAIAVVPGLLVGLMISVFQAATQINEQTLSFLPRLLATLTALIVAGPWIVNQLMEFMTNLMTNIPYLIS